MVVPPPPPPWYLLAVAAVCALDWTDAAGVLSRSLWYAYGDASRRGDTDRSRLRDRVLPRIRLLLVAMPRIGEGARESVLMPHLSSYSYFYFYLSLSHLSYIFSICFSSFSCTCFSLTDHDRLLDDGVDLTRPPQSPTLSLSTPPRSPRNRK